MVSYKSPDDECRDADRKRQHATQLKMSKDVIAEYTISTCIESSNKYQISKHLSLPLRAMTIEKIQELRERIAVLRRFL